MIQESHSLVFTPKSWKLKNLHMDVQSSFIHNCQNVEATKVSFSGWMNKLWFIQTMEYYSALKRNELPSHEKTWRKCKCILLSERSQSEKATYCIIPAIWHSGKGKTLETVKRSMVPRNVGRTRDEGGAQRIFRAVKILCVMP